jgi:hypothetical protein
MRVLVPSCSLLLVGSISACGTGGISPQPPNLGRPWFEQGLVTQKPPVHQLAYTDPYSLSHCGFLLHDQNLDGHLDVLLITGNANGYVATTAWTFLGNGNAGLLLASPLWADMWTDRRWAASGDFDGDGRPDLVVTDAAWPGVLSVLRDGGVSQAPLWWAPQPPIVTILAPGKVVAGDWDEDGNVDAAYLVPSLPFVFLLPGNGDGTFGNLYVGLPFPLGTGEDPKDLLAVDLDGDGHLDLATANRADDSVSVFLGDGDGQFATQPPVPAPGGPRALTAADLDGDGDLDLAVACFDLSFGVAGLPQDQIDVLLSTGRSWALTLDSFVPLDHFERPVDLVAGDFDGDGDVDLAYLSRALLAVGTLENDGQGGFTRTEPERLALPFEPQQLEVGDMNEDGKPDLLVFYPYMHAIGILENVTP